MTDFKYYFHVLLVGLVTLGVTFGYLKWLGIPGELNKATADTAIILVGLSMGLTSIGYFWNFFDTLIVYRKYLGLIGFAFALAHLILSWAPFTAFLTGVAWSHDEAWPLAAGVVALFIFTIMALISNSWAAKVIGGKRWRQLLRVGYVAVLLVLAHVVLLKSARWMVWFEGGMQTPPSLSLLVSIFMVVVVGMRVAMWWSLRRKKRALTPLGS